MNEQQKTWVKINLIDYALEDMTPEQQRLVHQLADLDQKINRAQLELDQYDMAKNAFFRMLYGSLRPDRLNGTES